MNRYSRIKFITVCAFVQAIVSSRNETISLTVMTTMIRDVRGETTFVTE